MNSLYSTILSNENTTMLMQMFKKVFMHGYACVCVWHLTIFVTYVCLFQFNAFSRWLIHMKILSFGVGTLKDYLALWGIASSGYKKIQLVARAFSAAEMGLPIIMSSEEQAKKLNNEYVERLKEFGLSDPQKIPIDMRIDDIKAWPKINLGNIFAYILSTRDFDTEYVGKYKDQKAYAYFDSGFVGEVLLHRPDHKKNVEFLYCNVRCSMKINDGNELWIAVQDEGKILTTWCTCTAGTSRCCNHAIALMYKLEYANTHGYIDVACTSVPCKWNKSTKKDIVPRKIQDMVVRKRVKGPLKAKMKLHMKKSVLKS